MMILKPAIYPNEICFHTQMYLIQITSELNQPFFSQSQGYSLYRSSTVYGRTSLLFNWLSYISGLEYIKVQNVNKKVTNKVRLLN